MHNIIWRNRASAILGLMIIVLPFTGFPSVIKTSLFVILGAIIALFGFTGTRHREEFLRTVSEVSDNNESNQ
ncbi:MAG: hypothetical protein K8Q91_03710 [Candidatus Vogelbacteria bacterium]|nr:hypothetical protein [Candidatus Vogelbacteria bacterium]